MNKNLDKIVFAPPEKRSVRSPDRMVGKQSSNKKKDINNTDDVLFTDESTYMTCNNTEKPIILLSLDPAQSCGWSIFKIYNRSESKENTDSVSVLIKCDFLEVDMKSDYVGDSCISLQEQVKKIIEEWNVDEICVEDYFMSSKKCQGANLNVYLRGSIYILCRELNLHYDIIPIWGWKSFVAGQTTPGKEMKKYYGKELANKIFIQEALWLRYNLRFPNYCISKNTGKPISLRYDMIDSVGIGLFHIHRRHNCSKLINELDKTWKHGMYMDMKTKKKSFQYDD
tara:strand:- start:7348 stop:8196 length:849 start_codon:yes stop_codon:yes gene_type:complete